ncbi:MAG TPA: CARDB domain-containing protein, partial [Chloroflexota bacterium]|nr:CARDB domain-containing protein [Chloroflexota bacterium]
MNARLKMFIGLTAVLLTALALISQMGRTAPLFAGSNQFIFLPIVTKPVSADLTITGVEITQATQKVDNSVPLVANRNTVVRVFAEAPVGGPMNNVVVRLTAVRNGVTLNPISSAPITIPTTTDRSNFNSSINFILPANWLSGNVSLTATIDPDNTIPESNESNNSLIQAMNFNDVPDLQIVIVPINYTHTGAVAPGYYPGQSADHISDWIRSAYPVDAVNVTMRTPYNFTGNLATQADWIDLLNRMLTVKLADGHAENTPIVYYAFVPISNGSTQWFFSGIAGIGWIGARESVGLNLMGYSPNIDATGELAGHEIGHNMGRRHAPCGNPSQLDENYPYAGASIGEYGLDIPNGVFWSPATAVDFMSYCDPAWISDYTYIGIYNDQRANGFVAIDVTAVDSMIVSAGLSDDGVVTLAPSYAFTSYPSTGVSGDYRAELLDENGDVLASQPMQLREAEEEG